MAPRPAPKPPPTRAPPSRSERPPGLPSLAQPAKKMERIIKDVAILREIFMPAPPEYDAGISWLNRRKRRYYIHFGRLSELFFYHALQPRQKLPGNNGFALF